jgi:hypoxanthine-guanine phosphoribosyltransferase
MTADMVYAAEECYVFGCGMDYKESDNFGRQLPAIYAVKGL